MHESDIYKTKWYIMKLNVIFMANSVPKTKNVIIGTMRISATKPLVFELFLNLGCQIIDLDLSKCYWASEIRYSSTSSMKFSLSTPGPTILFYL